MWYTARETSLSHLPHHHHHHRIPVANKFELKKEVLTKKILKSSSNGLAFYYFRFIEWDQNTRVFFVLSRVMVMVITTIVYRIYGSNVSIL